MKKSELSACADEHKHGDELNVDFNGRFLLYDDICSTNFHFVQYAMMN